MPDDSVGGTGGRADPVAPRGRSNRTVTPAIAAALVVLAASFALSVAFVLTNGGLDLPAAQRPSELADAVGGAPTPTSTAVSEASVAPPGAGPAASPPPEARLADAGCRADARRIADAGRRADASADVEPVRPAGQVPGQP